MRKVRILLAAAVVGAALLVPAGAGAGGARQSAHYCDGLDVDPTIALQATEGDDVIEGTSGPDVINALGGNDIVLGFGGDDVICGGPGNDDLRGGPGDDRLFGDDGNDRLRGAAGDDDMFGGAGSDRMIPEMGGGTLNGGPGSDIVDYLAGSGPVVVDLADGRASYQPVGESIQRVTLTAVEKVDGTAFGDIITGDGRRNVLRGKQGSDSITGGGGDDDLIGGTGRDHLYGDDGDDLLKGQADDDDLDGGAGADDLVGGPGDDWAEGGSGNDRIRGGRKAEVALSNDVGLGEAGSDTCLWLAGAIDCETVVNPPATARTCIVFEGTWDDTSFNWMAWRGALVTHALGTLVEGAETASAAGFAGALDRFASSRACDLVVTIGFGAVEPTAAAAKAHPGQDFLVLDAEVGAFAPWLQGGGVVGNVRGSTFAVEEGAFLAGYLAAGMTTTGTVGTFGGLDIPTVTAFMDGFVWGVEHYNGVHSASVGVLGWDPDSGDGLFAGGFDEASGATAAQTLIGQGADVILPAAGDGRVGAADRCLSTSACLVIGVDSDSFPVYYEDVWIASVVKGVDAAVVDTVENIVFGGTLGSRNYRGDLADGGTSLAPFPKYDDVPAWLQAELAALEAAIVAGTVPVG